MFKNHPRGLPVLFFTEMWERFGFYLMLGIFSLYMLDPSEPGPFGGMGFDRTWAAVVYGIYLAAVYLTPFFGGILADRLIGYRRSIVIGGVLMAAGYLSLAAPPAFFYPALALIVLGNGFFKPNISTIVGRLYEEGSPLKDAGYNIFYMGINIGAFFCNFVAAILRNRLGWGWAFAAAGVGMLIGIVWFLAGQEKLAGVSDKGDVTRQESTGKLLGAIALIVLAAIFTGWIGYRFVGPWIGTEVGDLYTGAFIGATVPVVAYFLLLWMFASREEKPQVGALLSIFAVVVIFWMIFHQNGSSLTYWAEESTRREAGVLAGPLELLYMDQDATIGKAIEDPDGTGSYWRNIAATDRPPRGEKATLISTELFQTINPFCVVLFTPLVVGFFGWLQRRGREPSTAAKIAWGMLVTAASTLFMVGAVWVTYQPSLFGGSPGYLKASPLWLVGTYAVITVGELCLSPMGLALVSKLAPPRVTALMMGGWFLATAIGNALSGFLASLWERVPRLDWIFWINCVSALAAAGIIAWLTPWIRRVMAEHERQALKRASVARAPTPRPQEVGSRR